ncbi:MAG TPA: alpha/beta fold hydrolase [Saprospiraceae bacterium]|nr:alpha/beta fold hydrolase [Saprospiraceae bacterium]
MHQKMILRVWALALALLSACYLEACTPNPEETGTPQTTACDTTRIPIVFVHGFLASGDTYATQIQRFTSNGYCSNALFAFDWNTLSNQGEAVAILNALIDRVLGATGAAQVHLAGHSAGGGLCYNYLSNAERASKVARYVHIGSGRQARPAGPNGETPTLNLWSAGDKVVAGGDIPGAENKRFSDLDHYQVATSELSFAAMYAFFNKEQQPTTTAVLEEKSVTLAGRIVTLGENQAIAQASIQIYEVDAATGKNLRSTPDAVLSSDTNGNWGPWTGKPVTRYMFQVRTPNTADRTILYYREAFVRSNAHIYLRIFPPPTSLAGLLLAGVPADDKQSVVTIFSANQAVIHNRDVLQVNGFDLATSQYASAERTSIAFFLYDNGDQQSSGNTHPAFGFLQTFLTGVDYFIPTESAAPVRLQFNGRTLHVPNWKSKTDGVVVAVFD